MHDPADTDALIARHFDSQNSPDEAAQLADLLLADPAAAAAFVEAARFEAMLERSMPLRKSRRGPILMALGAAAAVIVASVLVFRALPVRPADPGEPVTPAGPNWQPVKTASVPMSGVSDWALRPWVQMQQAEPDAFVPIPPVTMEIWQVEEVPRGPRLKVHTTATYSKDWKRKLEQARHCTVGDGGVIDLGGGKSALLRYIALASPQWPETRPASWIGELTPGEQSQQPTRFTPPVYFDPLGREITGPERIAKGKDRGLMTDRSLNHSAVELGLDLGGCAGARILNLAVFDAATHAWLSHQCQLRYVPDDELTRVSTEALIASRGPLTIALELALPDGEPFMLPPEPGKIVRTSLAEAQFIRGEAGLWSGGGRSASPGSIDGWEELELADQGVRDGFLTSIFKKENFPRHKHCTLAFVLPGEMEADVFAVTSDGELPALKGDKDLRDRWIRFACFETPLQSVQALKVQSYSRRRILLTVTPPRDPWNGLNGEVSDALNLRIPSVFPQTDNARLAVQTLLGIDEGRTYAVVGGPPGWPQQFKWSFAQDWPHEEMKQPTLRDILLELGRMKKKEIEIEVPSRQLRELPPG